MVASFKFRAVSVLVCFLLRGRSLSTKLEFIIPTWNEIYKLLLDLADRVRQDGFKPDAIVGVSRGGWPPGVAETKGKPVITQPVSISVKGKKLLIVDDVADSGKSLRLVRKHLKEKGAVDVKIAAIYYKPWSVVTPDYYERETRAWIIFPWERKEAVRNIVERYKRQGKSMEEAKERLVSSGMDPKIIERFLQEISEGQA